MQRNVLSTDVVLLRGKIEAMQEEVQAGETKEEEKP